MNSETTKKLYFYLKTNLENKNHQNIVIFTIPKL
ncbi:hypothetical protein B0I22_2338 [Epilithonimonas xixisoli]|uniref:Uncharacterized protein n=1 Tax=Epilithonimonas xixisoli TaxID=1476462 RepID=A0A4V3H2M4_9FLAO|nr:hypothetical protein B0I22_2338 [Epilithonimonas xixisoli]